MRDNWGENDFKGFVLGVAVAMWRIWIVESVIRGTDDRAATVTVQRRSDEAYFKEIA